MAIETVLIQLGTAAVRAAMKLWLGDLKIAAEVGASAVDVLAGRLTSQRDRRRLNRMIENFEEAVIGRIEPIVEREFRNLPENERLAAIQAVGETFERASLKDADLFASDLDAGHLDRTVRARVPNMTRDLSADGAQLYGLLLRESCGYVIEIARGLPPFVPNVLTELLRRDREISDGIQELLARLPPRGREDGFEYDYRQLVARTLDQVELFGVTASDASRRYPLSVAYISLDAVNAAGGAVATSRRVEELLSGRRRLFIRGEAGLGKTTLLQWIAVRSAHKDFAPPLTDWNGTVPFFIPLRRYADRPLPTPERFLEEIGRNISYEMPSRWVHNHLRDGNAVMLIDGVDELAADRRNEVRRWLDELITSFPLVRCVVTSRPSGVSRNWLMGMTVLDLQPMMPDDVQIFVERWYQAMRVQCVDDEAKAELDQYQQALLEQLREHSHLRRLARYPLLCALLCALHRDHEAVLPSNRMELYEVALNMLLERRDSDRRIPAPRDLHRRAKIILLGDFAYWLIRNGLSDTDVSRTIVRFREKLTSMPQVVDNAEVVYRHLLERSGLLREPVEGRVDFIHRTFQEYLAARSAVGSDDVGTLIENAHRDDWREVVVMAVGHASEGQRAELLDGLIVRGDNEADYREKLHLLAFASLETAPELDNGLWRRIETRAGNMLPPKSVDMAMSFASAGRYVLERLAQTEPANESETLATIRAAAETGLDEALPVLAKFGRDPRPAVQQELLRNWSRFDIVTYAQHVLADLPTESVTIREASLMRGLRLLPKLRHVHCAVPLDRLTDPFPPELRSLSLDLSRTVDLTRLAGLPLRYLSLSAVSGASPEIDVSPLAELPDLIEFSASWVRLRNLKALRASAVQALQVIDAATAAQLAAIPPSWELRELTLVNIAGLVDLLPLRFATGVQRLRIRDCKNLRDLAGIEAWADTLEHVALHGCPLVQIGSALPLNRPVAVDLD